jgi:ketosteroid isomerase-like protein
MQPDRPAEVVRRLSDALWRERDLDSALELIHPKADFDWSDSRAPYRGHFRGHAEMMHAFQMMIDAWDEWHPEFEEVIDVDHDTVLIVTHVRARGKESGVPVEARGASLWSVQDGKVTQAKLFQSKTEALAAAGVADER